VAIYRGVLLYGASGTGKSSLLNAGLIHDATQEGFRADRIRVQPRAGEELVVERIAEVTDGSTFLPSSFDVDGSSSPRVVLSTEAFRARLDEVSTEARPLLIFDQFEELITLFEEPCDETAIAAAREARDGIVGLLIELLQHGTLRVKLLFAFREDYLAKVKELFVLSPELLEQSLRLTAPTTDSLERIIRGPFEEHPGAFGRELTPELAKELCAKLAARSPTGELNLSEVQIACLRLWHSDDPDELLAEKGIEGLLVDDLQESLSRFSDDDRYLAVALLSEMVTAQGTRNVISAENLIERVQEAERMREHARDDIDAARLQQVLDELAETRLVRGERRHDLFLYEIGSEFLLPWIAEQRQERLQDQAVQEEAARRRVERRKRFMRLLAIGGVVVAVAALAAVALAVWALKQRGDARAAARKLQALELAAAANAARGSNPNLAAQLAYVGYRLNDSRPETRNSMISALEDAQHSTVRAIATLQSRHGPVFGVAFSPNGKTLATADADGTVSLVDVRSDKPLGRSLSGHSSIVDSVAFSPDGRILASGGVDGTIRLWNTGSDASLGAPIPGRSGIIYGVAFSPDGRLLASAGADGTIRLWEVRTHRSLGPPLTGRDGAFYGVAFSPRGHALAAAGGDGTIRLWNTRTETPKLLGRPLVGHNGNVYSVAFSRDGRTLASAGADGSIRLWNARTGRALRVLRGTGIVYSVAFSRDGHTLASAGSGGTIQLWDLRIRKGLGKRLGDLQGNVYGIAFSPDGNTLASAGFDATVRLWDTSRQLGHLLPSGVSRVSSVAFSPDGSTLASAGIDGRIRLWNTETDLPRGPTLNTNGARVNTISFSPHGGLLAAAGDDGTVRLWDTSTYKPLELPLNPRAGPIYSVAFSPKGDILAAAGRDGVVRLWDTSTHKPLEPPLNPQAGPIYSVAFSPKGDMLAAAGQDGVVRLWSSHTKRPVGSPLYGRLDADVKSIAFSPDGKTLAAAVGGILAAGSDAIRVIPTGKVELWDVNQRSERLSWTWTSSAGPVESVAFDPIGPTLAAGGNDGAVRLFDTAAGQQLGRPLHSRMATVYGVVFSPDGTSFASGGAGGPVVLWSGILWHDRSALRKQVCTLAKASPLKKAVWDKLPSASTLDYEKWKPC
jgi:WD40 repeat protein